MIKKAILVILVLLIVYLLLANAIRPKILYPAGRDTVESFNDGTYQILSGQTEDGLRIESLYNCKYNALIIQQVEDFRVTNGKVYVTGNSIQYFTSDKADIKCTYEIIAVIEIETNRLMLCVIPDSSTDRGIYIRFLDEMINNGEAQLLSQLTDFSQEDQSVFEGFGHSLNNK